MVVQVKMTLQEAMARQEGFYVSGSRASKNNNPGNLETGKFCTAHGATGSDGGFAQFPTVAAGWAAQKALLQIYGNLTIEQMLNKYAPPVENQTSIYLKDVLVWTGLTKDTLVKDALNTNVPS